MARSAAAYVSGGAASTSRWISSHSRVALRRRSVTRWWPKSQPLRNRQLFAKLQDQLQNILSAVLMLFSQGNIVRDAQEAILVAVPAMNVLHERGRRGGTPTAQTNAYLKFALRVIMNINKTKKGPSIISTSVSAFQNTMDIRNRLPPRA